MFTSPFSYAPPWPAPAKSSFTGPTGVTGPTGALGPPGDPVDEVSIVSDDPAKEKVVELLYDMHADPDADRKEMTRLLQLYKNMTGKEKPLFMA
jgi:hypothetical protein